MSFGEYVFLVLEEKARKTRIASNESENTAGGSVFIKNVLYTGV